MVSCERKDWWQIVESARTALGLPNFSAYACMVEYDICRRSVLDLLSLEIMKLWRLTGGFNVKTPAEYYQLPAFWTECVMTIQSEMNKVTDGQE